MALNTDVLVHDGYSPVAIADDGATAVKKGDALMIDANSRVAKCGASGVAIGVAMDDNSFVDVDGSTKFLGYTKVRLFKSITYAKVTGSPAAGAGLTAANTGVLGAGTEGTDHLSAVVFDATKRDTDYIMVVWL